MRAFFVLLMLFANIANAQSQNETPPDALEQNDFSKYQQQWKRRKHTGKILLITGGGISTVGLILGLTAKSEPDAWLPSEQEFAAILTTMAGGVVTLSSLPFFGAASNSKKKMMKIQPTLGVYQNSSLQNRSAAVGIQLKF